MFSNMEESTFLYKSNLDFIAQELANSHVIDNIICDLCDCNVIPERCTKDLLSCQNTQRNKARQVVSLILKGGTSINQREIAIVFYRNGLTSVAEMFDSQYISSLDTRDTNSYLDGNLHTLPNLHSSASLPSLSVTPQEPLSPDSTMSLDPPSNSTYDHLRIAVTPSVKIYGGDSHPEIYKNESRPRGYVFLSNTDKFKNNRYKERIGSNTDVENLRNLFNQMGYIVEEHINLSKGELYKALDEFSTDDEKLSKVDSCIVVVMSHGNSAKNIVTADDNTIRDEEIISYFSNKSCRALCGKPKIFIFQYCRGTLYDVGTESPPILKTVANAIDLVRVTNTTDGACIGETIQITTIPSYTDIYCVYAAIEGHVAYLNEERGSWLVQSICAEFMENAHNTDFEKLMKMVSQRISRDFSSQEGRKQLIERSIRGFDKHFYFNPQPLWHMNLSDTDSLLNLQDLNLALPMDMTTSLDSNLSSTPPHERRARAWEAESRSSTPDILSPFDLQHSVSGVWNKSRHNSGASLGSRDAIPHSTGTAHPNNALKTKHNDQRRFSFGGAIAENGRMLTNDETSNGVTNFTVDEVDYLRPKITGTAEDFRKYRLFQCAQNKDERPTSFKRQLSAPTESEAMRKINSLEHYLQINDMDEHLPFLNPIKEAINERKLKAKKKRREINTPDF